MIATELQQNDLVMYKGDVCHITSLDALGGLVGIANEGLIELVSESEIQPIPLTAEILEKNGFCESDEVPNMLCLESDEYHIYYGLHNTAFCVFQRDKHSILFKEKFRIAEMKYVHRLHQALRLCGLNDLADNLKIE